MQGSEHAAPEVTGADSQDGEPVIYVVVKGYGRGLRVFKVPPLGDAGL